MNIDFKKQGGLVPVIAQDYASGRVLMLAYMNEEALEKTLSTGKVHYYSRTRNKLWLKGESSGNIQVLKDIYTDCDNDTILVKIEQIGGAACHEGYESCFFRHYSDGDWKEEGEKVFDPKEVYK